MMLLPIRELPPRARRIRHHASVTSGAMGTTSACAENTQVMPVAQIEKWNYLRVRGEYATVFQAFRIPLELPPRARRILGVIGGICAAQGTTSACAENTLVKPMNHSSRRNYLRVRGEYAVKYLLSAMNGELPPRARRIPIAWCFGMRKRGTTSACAENTCDHISDQHFRRNYLRVRGEYPK